MQKLGSLVGISWDWESRDFSAQRMAGCSVGASWLHAKLAKRLTGLDTVNDGDIGGQRQMKQQVMSGTSDKSDKCCFLACGIVRI